MNDLTGDETLPPASSSVVCLPPPDTKRWVPRRKAAVVDAVRSGVIGLEVMLAFFEVRPESEISFDFFLYSRDRFGLR